MGFLGTIRHIGGDVGGMILHPVDSGRELADETMRTLRRTGRALEEAGLDAAAFFHPLKTVNLPDGYGTVYIYPGVYRIFLTPHAIDAVGKGTGTASAIAGLVGAIVGASGGTLAPVAGILAAYLGAEWAAIEAVKTSKGVYLNGSWVSPSVIVPTPA